MTSDPRPVAPPLPTGPTTPPFAESAWGNQLNPAGRQLAWLWHGYLAAGNLTLLTAQWKSGKTTLLSILLARLKQGGTLAGLDVTPGKAVVISEESRAMWHRRHQKLDLGHVAFFCRPFRNRPRLADWVALLDQVAELHCQHGFNLLVVDTLAALLPGRSEAHPAAVTDALQPVQHLAERGMSALLLHHPCKGNPVAGQAARGSGALPAFANISLEMYACGQAGDKDRRRRLLGFSHHEQTPEQLVLELNAEGTDYRVLAGFAADEFLEYWSQVRLVLEDATDKWTRQEILAEWSHDFPRPAPSTLWRWLQRAVDLNLVCQEGTGRKDDPFRYWLAEKEAQWRADPLRRLMQGINDQVREQERQRRPPVVAEAVVDPGSLPSPPVSPLASAAEPAPPPGPAAPPPAADPGAAAAPACRPAVLGANADFLRPYLAPNENTGLRLP